MKSATPILADRPYTVSEGAEYLRISTRSLRRTVAAGLIAFTKLPFGALTFERTDLDELRRRFRHEAADPITPAMSRQLRLVNEAVIVEQAKRRVDARRTARGEGR